jgi:MFS family permease
MGLLTGFAFVIFYSLLGIPIARWADRGNRSMILSLGLTVWSGFTALSGFAQNYVQLALARVGVGIGEAAGAPPSHALISDYFEKDRRSRAMAIFQSSIYLGVFLGYFVGGWISQNYGWRAALWVAGVPGILVALVIRFTLREPLRGAVDDPRADTGLHALKDVTRFLVGQRSYVLIAAGVGLVAFTNFAFAVWSPSFLRRLYGMNAAEAGFYLGWIKGIIGMIGTVIGGLAVERLKERGDRWLLILPALVTVLVGPALALFLFAPEKYLALAALGLATLLVAFHLGPCLAIAQALVKIRMRSLAASMLLLSVNLIGLGFGPFVVGALSDLLNGSLGAAAIRYALLSGTVTCTLGAGCLWAASRYVAEDLRNCETE